MRTLGWTFVAIILVFAAAVAVDLPGTTQVFGRAVQINQGIDIAGGARALLCSSGTKTPSDTDMNTARDVIAARAAGGLGVVEPQVTRVGSKCISVELPGKNNQDALLSSIGKTGFLALTDSGATQVGKGTKVKLVCQYKGCAPGLKVGVTNMSATPPVMQVVVPGKYVSRGSAQVTFGQAGDAEVQYSLSGRGSTDWCNYTTAHHNPTPPPYNASAIVLDNQVVSDPNVQDAICGGQTVITGLTSSDEAKSIATYLNYGSLPVALHIDSSSQVASSLGSQYVDEAKKAGIIGLIIVALFMLLYYRLPGLLADLALILYSVVTFAAFKVLGVTMTLAGIAGFILSIGMAVDANVLVFERMKEEMRSGKSVGAAVEAGFRRAWPSIRDSNTSTMITTVILFWFGHNFAASTITGFATTLFIGVAISMATAFFVSRTFLRLLVQSGRARDPQYFGVEPVSGGRVA